MKQLTDIKSLLERIIEETEDATQAIVPISRLCELWQLTCEAENKLLDYCLDEAISGLTIPETFTLLQKLVNPIVKELQAKE